MSQVNETVFPAEHRAFRRVVTALAVVAGMGAVAVFQLRQEAARSSATVAPAAASAAASGAAAPGR